MSYDIQINRAKRNALIELRGNREMLEKWLNTTPLVFPDTPNTRTLQDTIMVCWVGPERWLLRTSIERENQLRNSVPVETMPRGIDVHLVSDTLTFFDIVGPDAAQILAIVSPLDIHPCVFPDNGISFTEGFGVSVLVARQTNGFELVVESSYADWMEVSLHRAAGTVQLEK